MIDFVLILTYFVALQYILDAIGILATDFYIKHFGWPMTMDEALKYLSAAIKGEQISELNTGEAQNKND